MSVRLKYRIRSRLDNTPATEFEIPHYAVWDDGSEYEVWWGHIDRLSKQAFRRFHGPMFGRALGDWKMEELR